MDERMVGTSIYTFAYNEEDQLTTVSGAATGSFVYDGDRRRVRATVGGATMVYIGDHYGWTGSASTAKLYYSAGAQSVAMRTVQCLVGDHLGLTRFTLHNTGGLAVIPQEIVVDVYHKARALVSKESEFRKQIREGISGADAVRTFGPSI